MSNLNKCLVEATNETQLPPVSLIAEPTLIVFSHLRWHFVTQRPQHLLCRAAKSRNVYFWEEPWFHDAANPESRGHNGGSLEFLQAEETSAVTVIRPHFNKGEDSIEGQRRLLNRFLFERGLKRFDSWYYTPMALSFTSHLHPRVTIYDCMDELSAFLGAPPELIKRENELFRIADVVFTGGRSIYEAKRSKHFNVHAFPSSIDVPHFAQAREAQPDPSDQAIIPNPRVGFFGVLDERFDSTLVAEVARLRPEIHFVLLGPVVKIEPALLPAGPNIHYIGSKSYGELPRYIAGWDAAILPFAMNDSTRFISPTKTPEYLAAGKRVVSTPIKDVVTDYGRLGLVEIAGTATEFANAIDRALYADNDIGWVKRVEDKLSQSSWDLTWDLMRAEIDEVGNRISIRDYKSPAAPSIYRIEHKDVNINLAVSEIMPIPEQLPTQAVT